MASGNVSFPEAGEAVQGALPSQERPLCLPSLLLADRSRFVASAKIKAATELPGGFFVVKRRKNYLILASLNITCLRMTGSYLRISTLSVSVRGFLRVT
jgi:hypothetical protein